MRHRIENSLQITCEDVDLTTISNIEFYVRQPGFFREYRPEVVSAKEMLVHIPFEDAMELRPSDAMLQFAYTDSNGVPRATEIEEIPVSALLKEAGYDPV